MVLGTTRSRPRPLKAVCPDGDGQEPLCVRVLGLTAITKD